MTKTYAAVFAPVALPTAEAFERLSSPLRRLSAVFTGQCYELRAGSDGSNFRFVGDVRVASSAAVAALGPPAWAGVAAQYRSRSTAMAVAALGGPGPAETTFAFLPDSMWVTEQQYNPAALDEFLSALTEAAGNLGADYWIYELDPALTHLSRSAFLARLGDDLADPANLATVAVAATAAVLPLDELESVLARACGFERTGEYCVARANAFPQVDDE